MARKKTKRTTKTTDFRHKSAKRTNIPPAKIAGEGAVPDVGRKKYAYSPHLSPVLRFDPEARADKVREIVEKACLGKALNDDEKEILRAVGNNWNNPYLEWAGRQEEHDRHWRTIDPVALHIHERVSANAILSTAKRRDIERDLFADPELEYQKAVQFYKHDMDWANRLILGDSLEVMSSLIGREGFSGKVQMVYIDPPYGIAYSSNFQPEMGAHDVKDNDASLTREAEMVRAYRDTWELGVHSYLSYLRDRLMLSRELLSETGSVFVQMGDENLHLIQQLMGECFGAQNFMGMIPFRVKSPLGVKYLGRSVDFLIWFAKDRDRLKFRPLFVEKKLEDQAEFNTAESPSGHRQSLGSLANSTEVEYRALTQQNLASSGYTESCTFPFTHNQATYPSPRGKSWKTNRQGMERLARAERLVGLKTSLRFAYYLDDFPVRRVSDIWMDTFAVSDKRYVVETSAAVIERCIQMTTDPGDLVLDPTCGSGTTAFVAEQWGRRWITTDTSRVAISLARQRLLTSLFPHYLIDSVNPAEPISADGEGCDPSGNFSYATAPHITLGSIAQNANLDPLFEKHDLVLDQKLSQLNRVIDKCGDSIRASQVQKLADRLQDHGVRATTDADCRRWLLPGTAKELIARAFAGKSKLKAKHVADHANLVPPNGRFQHWHVPFDTDPDWPEALSKAVLEYRTAWRAKMDEVNECIAANADQEVLVDQPRTIKNVVRVSGPFTVEGVVPEELNIGEEGLFDGTPDEELQHREIGESRRAEPQNLHAYLHSMVAHLQSDGVTFPDNKNPQFSRLEALFDSSSASAIHAEGVWEDGDADGPARVGVGFGPQYGPVTAMQVEELIREASRRGYDELVIAGFSFDAEAHAIIQEDPNPKVRAHMAQIRPDLNAGMEGLLKDTPRSQLFTVFGTPSIEVAKNGCEYTVTLEGVDIYDPVRNVVQATGASKVAAWFLDSDFNGRAFCITQAFFPDQDAWAKLAKALKDVADPEAFAAFKGTTSLPFEVGEHRQVAVKVIDPRGNEVMTIHRLEG